MRLLVLLAIACACDSGSHDHACPAPTVVAQPPVTQPGPAPAPVPAPAPPPAAAASPDAMVPLASVVYPVPPLVRPRAYTRLAEYAGVGEREAILGDVGPELYSTIARAAIAVDVDPSAVRPRFFEACLLARAGHPAMAADVVRPLVDQRNCPVCTDALQNAPACPLEVGTLPKATPIRVAATAIMAALATGDDSGVSAYLDDKAITIVRACSVCDENVSTTHTYTAATFRAHVREAEERQARSSGIYIAPEFLFCDGTCCVGLHALISHSTTNIESICFRGTEPKLESIGVSDG